MLVVKSSRIVEKLVERKVKKFEIKKFRINSVTETLEFDYYFYCFER